MRVLDLTIKREWLELIRAGEKLEEYREIKPHWERRLEGKVYDVVRFRNGYAKGSPVMTVELKKVYKGLGVLRWGAPELVPVYVLELGEVLEGGVV